MGRSLAYWVSVGWWWEPVKWVGRVILWFVDRPVGQMQSAKHEFRRFQNRGSR